MGAAVAPHAALLQAASTSWNANQDRSGQMGVGAGAGKDTDGADQDGRQARVHTRVHSRRTTL